MPLDAFGHYLAGASLADGSETELTEIGETLALGLLGSPSLSAAPARSLQGAVARARRILFDAELDSRRSAPASRVSKRSATAPPSASPPWPADRRADRARLRDGVMRDAGYAAFWHGGLEAF